MAIRKEIDAAEWEAMRRRMHERRWLLAASCVLALGLWLMYAAKTRSFDEVQALLAEKKIVNLSAAERGRDLAPVFAAVYPDSQDQAAVTDHVVATIASRRQSRLWRWTLSNVGRLHTSGFALPAWKAEAGGAALRARLARSRARLGMDPRGRPLPPDPLAAPRPAPYGSYQIRGRVVTAGGQPLPGVAVTLRGTRGADTVTDAAGRYRFEGLARGDTVAVRPVRRYYAFTGRTFHGLSDDRTQDFEARPHRIGLLEGASSLRRLKPRLVVRSPAGYRRAFWGLALLYFAAIYGLHLFWFRRRFAGDAVLLPALHLLTGLALLLMFSLPDPLRDVLRAQGYVVGVVAGCLLLGATSQLDFQHRFWRRHPFRWLGLGVVLAALLYLYGSGPSGSDAKVNLPLPLAGSVQPVEGIKLCLVLFLAGYFARNWAFLRELKQREGLPRFLQRLDLPRYGDLLPVAASIVVALGTFYVLHDMGPALVIGCTFLVLYGVVRNRWLAVAAGSVALVAGFWVAYRFQAVPVVANRVQMLLSPWENFVVGGEHLAHAYWALATGGVTGQGLGQGSPNYIPAAHTDMVLPALGEEVGLLGLLVVFALYAVLLYRALRIALDAGGIHSLFLGVSVALVLLFQIILIAGGAFGLIPLSGVVAPFASFGKSSMVVHCILLGMLMSISARPGTAGQRQVQQHHFRRPVRYVLGAAWLLLGGIALKAAYVQTAVADDWSIRPALMVRESGARAYTYNPRILDARRSLTRGTIYDRNGVPLATSRWEELERFRPAYEASGVDLRAVAPTDERYYPFGALAFYLLGDVGTRVKWGAPNSLYAEHAYLSHLRGYDNDPRPVEKQRVKAGPAEPIVRYNYAELMPLVRFGPAHRDARALIRRDRNLHLTIDVRLQQRVARVMRERVPEGKTASAVVLDAASGDVLASVTVPLPDAAFSDPAQAHRDEQLFDRGYGRGAKPPGSVSKLITAIAALNRDPQAVAWTHPVRATNRYARRGEPTGRVTMARAVIASSNVYFAALAREVVGADSLLRTLEAFGFRVGDPALDAGQKRALLRAPDNLRQAGFGQGPVTAGPLQVALVAATIANGGLQPALGWVQAPDRPRRPGRRLMDPQQAHVLAGFMRRVVTDREGTARRLRDLSIPMAGKTGTAEEVKYLVRDGERVRTRVNHAWFTGFAPYEEPGRERGIRKIAVAVLVEEGGSGGRVAAPIAGAIVEEAADLGLFGSGLLAARN